VRQGADHGVPRGALASAATAPLVRLDDTTRQDSAIRLEPLPDDFEAELLQASERGQVRASEGSVRHVEVFRMGGVGTSILGRPRPLHGHRRADHRYTPATPPTVKSLLSFLEACTYALAYLVVTSARDIIDNPLLMPHHARRFAGIPR